MADVDTGPGVSLGGGLETLAQAAQRARTGEQARSLPPVHLWNPPFCGDIGMRIARDGTWFYQGGPIGRPALVALFASILRKDPEGHMLVTPVEKVSVEVEDAPFLAVSMREGAGPGGPELVFVTNVGDEAAAGPEHPLRFEPGPADGLKPYVLVRGDLWALVTRPLFLDLVERGEVRAVDGRGMFGVSSGGSFFPMAPAEDMAP
ncbi:MAG: hypothetical protein JWN93_738 [Hyphomicrobiales bacterium]|nr:hypothetical protein [Hyphomicrobiales bacterium]